MNVVIAGKGMLLCKKRAEERNSKINRVSTHTCELIDTILSVLVVDLRIFVVLVNADCARCVSVPADFSSDPIDSSE